MPFRSPDPMLLATRLAARCESELAVADDVAAHEALAEIFRQELTPGLEYIVLMAPDGYTFVHTNAMREGRVYSDPVSLAAAALRTPTSQCYDRNTGEVIREAIVPVRSCGQHHSVLRVGQIVIKGSLRRRVGASLAAAAVVPSAAAAVVAGPTAGLVSLAAGSACAGALAVWNNRRISLPIRKFRETARAVSCGDLTASVSDAGRDELGQMGFELNKVVLGLQKVIEAGAHSSNAVSELAGQMAARTGETATAMAEIASSAHRTHETAERQAEQAHRAVEAAGHVASGLATVGKRAAEAQTVLADAHQRAAAGDDSLVAAAQALTAANAAVSDGTARVEALRERGQAIEGIVTLISSIAAQTNLLALNAAVEGARAGEHGRGFMVVATEVGTLAEQADAAATSIGELVAEVVSETGRAVAAMSTGSAEVASATSALRGVRDAVDDLNRHIDTVAASAAAAETETQGLGQDAELLGRVTAAAAEGALQALEASELISSATRVTAAGSDENATAANELSERSQELGELVGRFRVK